MNHSAGGSPLLRNDDGCFPDTQPLPLMLPPIRDGVLLPPPGPSALIRSAFGASAFRWTYIGIIEMGGEYVGGEGVSTNQLLTNY